MIQEFISQFTNEQLFDEQVIELYKRCYLPNASSRTTHDPTYTGIYLGTKGKKFTPSFLLLERIKPHTDRIIRVDDRTAWLFVCGRDILNHKAMFKDRTPVLVCTEKDEVLGYGMYWEGKISVRNLLDRGDFLRRER